MAKALPTRWGSSSAKWAEFIEVGTEIGGPAGGFRFLGSSSANVQEVTLDTLIDVVAEERGLPQQPVFRRNLSDRRTTPTGI